MRKKRILYIESNRDGTIGGSYYSLLYLLQGINKEIYDVHVLFCQDNDLIPEFAKVTNNVYVIDFEPSFSVRAIKLTDKIKWIYRLFSEVIFKQLVLRKIIKKIRPDLVHLNNGYAILHEWMLAGCINGFKVIAHDRGTRPPASFRTKIFVRCLDAIICVSENYKQNVINDKLKVKNLYRVYNGLDAKKWAENIDNKKVELIKKELNLSTETNIVGIVGNIDVWKGQRIVVEAIEIVKKKCPNIKCLIVGSVCSGMEKYKEELDEYINDNKMENNVVFMGYQDDIPTILSILDIFIHASIEPEPFGRVILEAMAVQKPIIATNGGGIPEIVTDQETGILVPMADAASMANAILCFLQNKQKAKSMALKGYERLIKKFSNEKMVSDIEEIYKTVFNDQV